MPADRGQAAILVSGGLDSAVLLAEMSEQFGSVTPIFVHCGLVWERIERDYLGRFLAAVQSPSIQPCITLDVPVTDLYGDHWGLTGEGVPDDTSNDEAVYLPGRNLLLLSKASIWCSLHGVSVLALAPLAANPFPDATEEFFRALDNCTQAALRTPLSIVRPFAKLTKVDVIRRAGAIPLQFTFSCIRPAEGQHCGNCNKCAERKHGFREAGVTDPTHYLA